MNAFVVQSMFCHFVGIAHAQDERARAVRCAHARKQHLYFHLKKMSSGESSSSSDSEGGDEYSDREVSIRDEYLFGQRDSLE